MGRCGGVGRGRRHRAVCVGQWSGSGLGPTPRQAGGRGAVSRDSLRRGGAQVFARSWSAEPSQDSRLREVTTASFLKYAFYQREVKGPRSGRKLPRVWSGRGGGGCCPRPQGSGDPRLRCALPTPSPRRPLLSITHPSATHEPLVKAAGSVGPPRLLPMRLLAPGYISLGETQYCLSKLNGGPDRFGEEMPAGRGPAAVGWSHVVVNGHQNGTFFFTETPTELASR